jgi:hypothetical protein
MSLARTLIASRKWEIAVSFFLLVAFLVLLGDVAGGLNDAGWPVEAPAAGIGAAVLYSLLCGRDLSYVGMFVLSAIASTTALCLIYIGAGATLGTVAIAIGLNLAVLLYFVYDIAALLSRRRLGEELGAVADLYRDLLNVFGYSIRVVRHWQTHRIWSK